MYHQGNDGGSGGPCHNIFQRKEAELLHEAMAKEALADMTSYKIVLVCKLRNFKINLFIYTACHNYEVVHKIYLITYVNINIHIF